jgi:hypothetical protein
MTELSTSGNVSAQPGRGRGCFFYGCLIAAVAGVIAMVLVLGAGYFTAYKLKKFVQTDVVPLTDEQPRRLTAAAVRTNVYPEAKAKLAVFGQALEAGQGAELSLSADEINALIAAEPALESLRGRVLIDIKDGEVGGQVSMPLSFLPIASLKNRFMNGSAKFRLGIGLSGGPEMYVKALEVHGQAMPDELLKQFGSKDLLEPLRRDAKSSANLDRIKSLRVEDGRVIVGVGPGLGRGQSHEKNSLR